MKKKLQKLALTLCVGAVFVGCDEAGNAVSELKKSIPTIEEPVVVIEQKYVDMFGGMLVKYVKITSKDNNMVLEDVILNRGNCGIKRYEISEAKLKEYKATHPNNVFPGDKTMLEAGGDLVPIKGAIYNNQEGMNYYNSLNESSKAVYELVSEFRGEKLVFGRSASFYADCNVIEVEVVTNGGNFTFNVEQ